MSIQSPRRESRPTDSDFVPPEIVPAETANNLWTWESASIVKRHGWLR
jgi:hypothetical protein